MSDNKDTMIQVKDLHKSFGKNNVLNGISTDIKKGEVVVVIGPSGSGKSTFLRSLNLLEQPTSGSIIFDGDEITDPKTNTDRRWEWYSSILICFHTRRSVKILRWLRSH